jgi:hypothetical protein
MGRKIMKQFIAGIGVGILLLVGTTVFAAEPVKQFILTAANYPIFVNGKEFKEAPILNYEGSTYVPLAKLGEITGVNYKWNDALKRVEIVTGGVAVEDGNPEVITHVVDVTDPKKPDRKQLFPEIKVVEPKGLVVENGETVFYAYDRDGNYKGRFTEEDNAALVIARIKRAPLPPKFSEGWIGAGFLLRIYGDVGYDGNDYVIRTGPATMKQEEFYRFPLPEGFGKQENGETISNGVRLKNHDGGFYFNIADLQKVGLLQ